MRCEIGLLMGLLTLGVCYPKSPCPKFYTYYTDRETDLNYGIFEIIPPADGMDLEVTIGYATKLRKNEIEPMKLIERKDGILPLKQKIQPLHYQVFFPVESPVPSILEIKIDNIIYCTSKLEESDRLPTNITFENRRKVVDPLVLMPEEQPVLICGVGVQCGEPAMPLDHLKQIERITSPKQWPWLAVIYLSDSGHYQYICSGTLISTRTVLTSANCVPPKIQPRQLLRVALGISNLFDLTPSSTVTRYVREIRFHPEFRRNEKDGHADLAILVLGEKVDESDSIKKLCVKKTFNGLPKVRDEWSYLVGWGEEDLEIFPQNQPLIVKMKTVSKNKCLRIVGENGLPKKSFCAGRSDGVGACHANPGSSLVSRDEVEKGYYLRGIVSNFEMTKGTKSCVKPQYIIFTDISQYEEWIFKNMF